MAPLPDLQCQTLAAYLTFTAQHPDWSHRLVLVEADAPAVPVALAASIAGAAVLWMDPDPVSLRERSQQGTLDFSVTTLAEAVRILKNQLRKGEPVVVGLADPAATAWGDAVRRGLQPDALLGSDHASTTTLVDRGATRLRITGTQACRIDAAATWRDRRAGDQRLIAAAELLSADEQRIAAGWYRGAARLFPRDLHRCVATHWPASEGTA